MSIAKTTFFMALMTVFVVFVGHLFDLYFGGGHFYIGIFFLIAVGMNFFSYWFADTIVLKMHRAKVVTPEEAPGLHRMVDNLVARAKMPKPKVCIVPTHVPNAFATGRNPSHAAVAVTEGLVRMLDDDELEGVIAHELAHIRHYDMLLGTVVASLAGLVSMLAFQARWGMLFGGGRRDNSNPLAMVAILAVAFLAPMFAMIIRSLISHQQEFAADAGGGNICGNPLALAAALRKIERNARGMAQQHQRPAMGNEAMAHMYFINHFSLGKAASKLFSTHPPTEERIERLLAQAQKLGQV